MNHTYHNNELGTLEVFTGNIYSLTDGKPCKVLRNAKGEERVLSVITFDILVHTGQIKPGGKAV